MASTSQFLASRLFNVKGLRALVSGGGTGIGLMATQALAANGARVYITGRRQEMLDNVVKTHGQGSEGEIIALPGDVTNKDDIKRLVKEIEKREGGLHILINNAGIAGPKTSAMSEDISVEELAVKLFNEDQSGWDDVFRTNVQNIFFTTVAFLPLLKKFTFGGDAAGKAIHDKYQSVVINTTSISGLIKEPQNHMAYNASKAAANHLQRMFTTAFASSGVRFNSIAPGVFPSEMTGQAADERNKVSLEGQFDPKSLKVPANRGGEDEEIGGTVLYLASRAGQYTNGAIIPVDGGTLATNPSSY
ncbi:hypothetical protein JCM10207_008057 [Rhodosporidiobolus poonsookiae]